MPSPVDTGYTKVFIGHATPEDNYFAGWLAAKLTLLGYDVWCDFRELKGGDDFWREIEHAIRLHSIRFLFVISRASIRKKGTLQELAVADKIRDRGDFVIPLRLDQDVAFDALPTEIIRLNAVDFSTNWAKGLKDLVSAFEEDDVRRALNMPVERITHWWQAISPSSHRAVLDRGETYSSNWFPITLPESIHIHRLEQIRDCNVRDLPYATIAEHGCLISFASHNALCDSVHIVRSKHVGLAEFTAARHYDAGPEWFSIQDASKKVIQLVNDTFNRFLRHQGLTQYRLDREIFFVPESFVRSRGTRVDLRAYGKNWVQLTGKAKLNNWHFAISSNAFLYPIPTLSISYHVVFTRDGQLLDFKKQHRLRRSICKDWYNKKWRDLIIGTMVSLLDPGEKHYLCVPIGVDQSLRIGVTPITFLSPKGYVEPHEYASVLSE